MAAGQMGEMRTLRPIRRALISVWDKRRLIPFVGIGLLVASVSLATEFDLEPPGVIPQLLQALNDDNPGIRKDAVLRLGHVFPLSEDSKRTVLSALVKALKDEDKLVRYHAALVLSSKDPSAPEAVPLLLQILTDEDPILRVEPPMGRVSIRVATIFALGGMPMYAEQTVPVLVQIAREETPRSTVLHPLAELGRLAVPALIGLLTDPNPELRADAAETLGKMGSEAKEAAPALVQALKDDEPPVDSLAFFALLDIGPGAVPPLIRALESEEEDLRFRAEDLLGQIGTPEAHEAIERYRQKGLVP